MVEPPSGLLPSRDELRSVGRAAGLAAVGFATAQPFTEARVEIERRKDLGLHAGMQFTFRNPERSTTPTRFLEGARTLIVGALPYASEPPARARQDHDHEPAGEVAAFAWRDHYHDLRVALEAVAEPLRSAGATARVVADDNALVDRAAAVRAGIGWIGKNSNVLLPQQGGSWFVLGSVVTDAAYEPDTPIGDQCGACTRCIDGCPTAAIVADGVIDARRCLAWLVQAPGDFPVEFRRALGTRIYGCDDCQTVCPPSGETPVTATGDEVTSYDLLELLAADDETVLDRVGRWYIPQRDVRFVRRNLLIALGNIDPGGPHDDRIDRALSDAAASEDPLIAEHAQWSVARRAGAR